jgi:hypothetical protein
MIHVHVFAIHSDELVFRKKFLINALKTIEDICSKNSFVYDTYVIKDANDVMVDAIDKTEDTDVNAKIIHLEKEHISNFSKQKQAIQKIVELGEKEKEGDVHYYMCIEDDCIILPQFVANLEKFFENPSISPWDILFLCVCQPNDIQEFQFNDIREIFKILPSKECYLINVNTAKKLLIDLEKMHFQYRVQLSQWINKNPEVISKYPTKRISLEGSKVGVMPSSVNNNNILIYNRDFIKMFNMVLGREALDIDVATELYNSSSHLKSPDITHIYAVLMFKKERFSEAKDLFIQAVNENMLQNGKLEKNSEMLNNAINICGIYQPDRDSYREPPSKYDGEPPSKN